MRVLWIHNTRIFFVLLDKISLLCYNEDGGKMTQKEVVELRYLLLDRGILVEIDPLLTQESEDYSLLYRFSSSRSYLDRTGILSKEILQPTGLNPEDIFNQNVNREERGVVIYGQ